MNITDIFSGHKGCRLLFDINNASVAASIVRTERSNKKTILFSTRVEIKYENFKDDVIAALCDAVKNAAKEISASSQCAHISKDVRAFVHAPWMPSNSQHFSTKLQHETLITEKLLEKIVGHSMIENPIPSGYIELDRNITRVELNGYATTKPVGKRALTVGVSILTSVMPEKVYSELNKTFKKIFPNHNILFDAFLLGVVKVGELFKNEHSFSYLDIGGESTSLIVVEDSAIISSTQINFGSLYITRMVGEKMKTTPNAASSFIRLYNSNSCTPSQCQKIQTALEEPEAIWTKEFGDACAKLSKSRRMPTNLFITCDTKLFTWFKTASEKIDFAQFTSGTRPFNVESLSSIISLVQTDSDISIDTQTTLTVALI